MVCAMRGMSRLSRASATALSNAAGMESIVATSAPSNHTWW